MGVYLGIETSCDDTSVALVKDTGEVLDCISQNQDSVHAPFGGIVPEVASRNHTQYLIPLIDQVLQKNSLAGKDLAGIAATNRPGLIGSLLVGVSTAKALSMSWGIPWIGVNHLEGHLLAPFLRDLTYLPQWNWSEPSIALAVSGGHSTIYKIEGLHQYRILGSTLDDAAGEAFDKFGKMMGFGFPGGVQVDRKAVGGDSKKYNFPRGLIHEDNLNLSFSGLKSAAQRFLTDLSQEVRDREISHLCASFQEAVVDSLMAKLELARVKTRLRKFILTGGVAANTRLRQRAEDWATDKRVSLQIAPLRYCTDNAAMIALAGLLRLLAGQSSELNEPASPSSFQQDFL